jgi:hypothetical protein
MVHRASETGIVYTVTSYFWVVFNFLKSFFETMLPTSGGPQNAQKPTGGSPFIGRSSGGSSGGGPPKPWGGGEGRKPIGRVVNNCCMFLIFIYSYLSYWHLRLSSFFYAHISHFLNEKYTQMTSNTETITCGF